MQYYKLIMIIILVIMQACKQDIDKKNVNSENQNLKFELIKSAHSKVFFKNNIFEDKYYNYFKYEYMYNGGGCAILDINNDGLQDLLFISNQEYEKLYLNKGDFVFQDISKSAGIEGKNEWSTGVSIVDINADGWDDIYICNSLKDSSTDRKNKLYVNQKNNTFTEMADFYGIADSGYSSQAIFFDIENDGDLDLYVANQPGNISNIQIELNQGKLGHSGELYENRNQKFVNITKESKLINYGFSLSANVADINNDGYQDIYISNDYNKPDELFINNGDKTFTNTINISMRHISQFSMGTDIADINNDGWLDIFTADMVSEDRYRSKANMAGMNISDFWKIVQSTNQYQYMANSLQLNRGNGIFSEIAQLSGISKTDWSWAPLIADFNNDGFKDLYITNGLKRDVRNKDFNTLRIAFLENRNNPKYTGENFQNPLELLNKAPSVKISNYMYLNEGNLHFKNMAKEANMQHPSFSNGASYADLDNDGDLDIIVNNIEDEAFIYKNISEKNNHIRLKLIGENQNTKSIGARVVCYTKDGMQICEVNPNKSYYSASEDVIHFGLNNNNKIDSIVIRWISGKTLKIIEPKINQLLKLYEKDVINTNSQIPNFKIVKKYTTEIVHPSLDKIKVEENNFDDYKSEVLMPHKMSTLGPCAAIGDVNNDKLDDIYLGGSVGKEGKLFIQNQNGDFYETESSPWKKHIQYEDSDVLFYDVENDGDLDLIISSGSNEYPENSPYYQSRLYLNDGNGKFTDATLKLLPPITISTGVIKAFDMDGDQDKDLFIGGRQIPGKYGKSAPSLILKYENGKYIDETIKSCPELLKEFGLISCASFADIDQDKDLDLVVAGEWMSLKILINDGKGNFEDKSIQWKTDTRSGWWNCIGAVDLNQDGRLDFISGNLGLNTKFKASFQKPFYVYLDDFDQNGTWDTYLGLVDKDGKTYPVRGRQCSSEQMPFIKDKYKNYDAFAHATLEEILEGKKKQTTIIKKATEFRSGVWMNRGDSLEFIAFPVESQFSTMQDFIVGDFNKDGNGDILYGGNYYNREVETTKSDASLGGILLGNSNGTFTSVPSFDTGLFLYGDVRKLKKLKIGNENYFICISNNDYLKTYLLN